MAWEWSHTSEAYSYAYENLESMDRDFLEDAYAEIKATAKDKHGVYGSDLDMDEYEKALKWAKSMPFDVLVDFIWNFAEEYKTADNGGFNAYMCPYGCHTVPFSSKDEINEAYLQENIAGYRRLVMIFADPKKASMMVNAIRMMMDGKRPPLPQRMAILDMSMELISLISNDMSLVNRIKTAKLTKDKKDDSEEVVEESIEISRLLKIAGIK
ncbi:MAG: hypothetical protein WC284_08810 [Candidimonas sp.]